MTSFLWPSHHVNKMATEICRLFPLSTAEVVKWKIDKKNPTVASIIHPTKDGRIDEERTRAPCSRARIVQLFRQSIGVLSIRKNEPTRYLLMWANRVNRLAVTCWLSQFQIIDPRYILDGHFWSFESKHCSLLPSSVRYRTSSFRPALLVCLH